MHKHPWPSVMSAGTDKNEAIKNGIWKKFVCPNAGAVIVVAECTPKRCAMHVLNA